MNSSKQNKEPAAQSPESTAKKRGLTVREIVLFPMLGALMFCSKLLMEWAPNVHLIAMFSSYVTIKPSMNAFLLFALYR